MVRAAIIVLAGTESHADMARVTNALEAAREFKEARDDFRVIFDGAGTQWIEQLSDPDHDLHPLYKDVQENAGYCSFCSGAFDVETGLAAIEEMDDCDGHPSIRNLIKQGYEILTF